MILARYVIVNSDADLEEWCSLCAVSIVIMFLTVHTFESEVKATQPVTREGVCTTLKNNGTRLIHLHDLGHYLGNQSILSSLLILPTTLNNHDRTSPPPPAFTFFHT